MIPKNIFYESKFLNYYKTKIINLFARNVIRKNIKCKFYHFRCKYYRELISVFFIRKKLDEKTNRILRIAVYVHFLDRSDVQNL